MLTKWGKTVDPQSAWNDYPRPLLERAEWVNLNGLWDYAITPKEGGKPEKWDGKILVPFATEAPLSGVGRLLEPTEALWYRRSIPARKEGLRAILNFEAVDYEATIWLNGKQVGEHKGGNTAFSCDITDALRLTDNELVVRVYDATEGYQLNGKQRLHPGRITYTRMSGIWQTVWIENVPARHLENVDISSDIKAGTLTVRARVAGSAAAENKMKVAASFLGKEVATVTGTSSVVLGIPEPKLWSPESPNIYDLTIDLLDDQGKVLDSVKSYGALREVGTMVDASGNKRFTLNGKPIFHWGTLDQGWWPDGLLTPPSDTAMLSDIQFLKAAGFNMIRKHIKVEPRRYYMHCDRLGMMVWQDQVSGGRGPKWTRLRAGATDANWADDVHAQWLTEYKAMVDELRGYPCIVMWAPFNERWGQHRSMEVGQMAVAYDRTRLINIASGGNFWEIGDVADNHSYPNPSFPLADKRLANYVKVVGEFGGFGWPVPGHLWKQRNWGYGGLLGSTDKWKDLYAQSLSILELLRMQGVAGAVYTQSTDVEGEINGLLTYDREPKVEVNWLKSLSDKLLASPDESVVQTILATSETIPQTWRYSFTQPAQDWETSNFKDDSWSSGPGGFCNTQDPYLPKGTEWTTQDIWLRRTFQWGKPVSGRLAVRVYHNKDVEIYINGSKALALQGASEDYIDVPIRSDLLKPGTNVIAVHCTKAKTPPLQLIDVGLIEVVPKG